MEIFYTHRKNEFVGLFIFLLFVSFSAGLSAQQILPFTSATTPAPTISTVQKDYLPQFTITHNKSSEIVAEYNFQGGLLHDSHYGSRNYELISIPQFASMSTPGRPALPVHTDHVFLPGNAKVSIEILSADTVVFPGHMIQPALTPAVDTEGADEPEFVIDQKVYNTNAFFPAQPVFVEGEQFLRGNKLLQVAVAPVQFNPVTQELRVFRHIKYKITYQSGKTFQDIRKNNSPQMMQMMRNISVNRAQIPELSSAAKAVEEVNYIIITDSAYQAAADTLARWKQMLGYHTEIISSTSWTAAMVKDSIHGRYHSATIKPDYFVILGDHDDVPAEIHQAPDNTNFGTDLYYACMDGSGDIVPDMAHGRIPVSNSTEALNVVLKMVNYERNPVDDASFYQKGTNCAYYQGYEYYGTTYTSRRFTHTSEEVRDYLQNQGYSIDRIYEADAGISPERYQNGFYSSGQLIPSDIQRSNGFQWDGDRNDIAASINQGRFYVFHRDHGYTGGIGWAHPEFVNHSGSPDVQNLYNGAKTPVVFSINCHTGDFTQPESFAETFLRHSNGGAVGVVAPSYYSFSGPNDGFAAGLFDAIWSNPGLIPDFGFGGINNPSLSIHGDIYTMGDVVNQALIRMIETWNTSSAHKQYTNELYHYFGDPAMRIFTQQPTAIAAQVPDTIIDFSIQINNANYSNALATLTYNGRILGKTILNNGAGIITFADSLEDVATLTLSAHNARPLVKSIYVDNTIKGHAPAYQAKNIQFDYNSNSKAVSLLVSWDAGDGDHRIVKINNTDTFTDPVDGEEYTADNFYQGNGEQVVYIGEGTEVLVENLMENSVYWFRVYEYNNEGVFTKYTTVEETGNPNAKTDEIPFPVELLSFNASTDNDGVTLEWETASEINNDYFIVEKVDNEKINVLGTVEGAGNSNQLNSYSYRDIAPHQGVNYYRLSQIDFDGTKESSDILAVSYSSNKQLIIQSVYRDGNELVLRLSGRRAGDMQANLYSLDGRLVGQWHLKDAQYDEGEIRLTLPNIPQSYYLFRLTGNHVNLSRKIAITP